MFNTEVPPHVGTNVREFWALPRLLGCRWDTSRAAWVTVASIMQFALGSIINNSHFSSRLMQLVKIAVSDAQQICGFHDFSGPSWGDSFTFSPTDTNTIYFSRWSNVGVASCVARPAHLQGFSSSSWTGGWVSCCQLSAAPCFSLRGKWWNK